ncbi:class II aldolase/adducin family protein [Aerococcaceae bacterium NML191292]|nr:class II aldolase/adducin family protein [Aerococcaceae bacterium NML191292]MCW6661639.1 class II aldolase/adducin family protein [Aerococcaceae bacterium NML201209]MDO4774246.1 class II aldolase/adducin family protein [Aerococcaceae bacterium]
MNKNEQLVREQICDVCHKMWQLGWVAANDGNVSVRIGEDEVLATPTGMSKSFITPEKLVKLNMKGEILEALEGYRPSSEIKMHLRCYEERADVKAVVHAHPPIATGFALAHIPLDTYSLIESAIVIGSVPITPFGVPSTMEVPDAITPYLPEHDVMLLENHGALAIGNDVITAYYRMETLELVAKSTFHARMLLTTKGVEEDEIARETLETLFNMRANYKVTGRHPGYKKYNADGTVREI